MSKSKGNVMDPLDLINQFGADAVRFTLAAMAVTGRDLKLSTSRIAGYRNFGTKLWNAARFAEMNHCVPVKSFDPRYVKETLNKWIVGETARFKESFDNALLSYRFNDAAQVAYTHVWGKFCDWYVEFSKPLLSFENTPARLETQQTMAWALDQCLVILHPIMPFITEKLWGSICSREKLLITYDWPEYSVADLQNKSADNEIEWVINIIEKIRSVRSELRVPAGSRVPLIQLKLEKRFQAVVDRNKVLIEKLARLSSVSVNTELTNGLVTIAVEGGEFALHISDFIDVGVERARLLKAITRINAEGQMLRNKLLNEKFISKAPTEVIDEAKCRLVELDEDSKKLSSALARLKGIS